MSTRRAVLAGASGFIGQRLTRELTTDGYRVALIGRSGPDARWGEPDRIAALVGAGSGDHRPHLPLTHFSVR